MKKCDCYCEDKYLADYTPLMRPIYKTITRCNGTRERDECSCGGDRTKCDFYPEVREKAVKEQKEDDCLIVTYDCYPPDAPTLCIARKEGNKVRVLNTIQGDAAFGIYYYLTGGADLVEIQGKWKLNKDGSGTCDRCGRTSKNVWDYDGWQNYCGHCGAKMSV